MPLPKDFDPVNTIINIHINSKHNLLVFVRLNGEVLCWDMATKKMINNWSEGQKFIRTQKTHHSNVIFAFNENNGIVVINPFNINFLDICYIQTFLNLTKQISLP